MPSHEIKFKEITEKIIGAAFEVHNAFGNGFQEVVYQRALAIELQRAQLNFEREVKQEIFYKDTKVCIGKRRVDFIVSGKVLIEIKALSELNDAHKAQILNYMKLYNLEVGLLINFGGKSVTFKRFVL